jgi:hypothetical protein
MPGMKKKFLIPLFIGSFYAYGQKQPDRYELIMGKYTYETEYHAIADPKKFSVTRIKIPKSVTTAVNVNADGSEIVTHDTIEYFLLDKILDSLPLSAVPALLSSPVWLNWNGYEVEVCGISIIVLRPGELPYATYFGSSDISKNKELLKYLGESPSDTYIVFNNICFVPDMTKREKKMIVEKLGFKIL